MSENIRAAGPDPDEAPGAAAAAHADLVARAGDDAVRRAPADPQDTPADPGEPLNPA